MTEREPYYRYYDVRYGSDDELYGSSTRVSVELLEFEVDKHTPRGVWIVSRFGGDRRWVGHDARKKYAHPTKELALKSFLARKKSQIKIYRTRLTHAEHAKASAELMLADVAQLAEHRE